MIAFTQYHLPNGRRTQGGFDRPPDIEGLAVRLIGEHDVHFDVEILRDGTVSMTAEIDALDDPVIAIRLVHNQTPDTINTAVDELVLAAAEAVGLQ